MSQHLDRPCYNSQVSDRPCYSSQVLNRLCYRSQTDQCYSSIILKNSRKIHPRGMKACQQKDVKREREKEKQRTCVPEREREIPGPLAPLFICLSPPPGPALCKLDQPGMLFVLPEVLTLVLRPSFILISQAFPSLSFSQHHSRPLFPILTTKHYFYF